jgi:hypothetical protein
MPSWFGLPPKPRTHVTLPERLRANCMFALNATFAFIVTVLAALVFAAMEFFFGVQSLSELEAEILTEGREYLRLIR